MVQEKSGKKLVPPWVHWEQLSHRAEALDYINKGCKHSFYWIPYTIDFLLKSKISLQGLQCKDKYCKEVDECSYEEDFLHVQKFVPRPIRAVNRNQCFVVNRKGVMQGPFHHFEWLNYSWILWDLFHDVLDGTVEFNATTAKELWGSLYFRCTDDFVAGNYNFFSEVHLLLANAFPDRDTKHSSYSEVHAGADLWHNLEPVDVKNAKVGFQVDAKA